MKSIYLSLLFSCLVGLGFAQNAASIAGAYTSEKGDEKMIWLFVDDYCSQITFKDKQYISTFGGPFTLTGNTLQIRTEYQDAQPENVGQQQTITLKLQANGFQDGAGKEWKKQTSAAQALDGLWRITGRQQGDKMATMPKSDRKTIKILVDGYFQWVAINPAVKGFYGTGGGKYVFKDAKYAEHILFFSRDNNRVGAHLSFDGSLQNGEWHHRGQSSKNEPIHEIWSREK